MHSPVGVAAVGLLTGSLLVGAASASGGTIDLLEDRCNVCTTAAAVTRERRGGFTCPTGRLQIFPI
jgi:hypothetical protein